MVKYKTRGAERSRSRSDFQPKSHRCSKKGMLKPIFSTWNNPTLSRCFYHYSSSFHGFTGTNPLSFHSVLAPPILSALLHSEAPLKPPKEKRGGATSGRLQDVSGCCITKERTPIYKCTHLKFNIAPENISSQRTVVFQPSFFRGELLKV